jgi:hypothetical protein
MKVTITRSAPWLRERRLATGQNVPDTIDVEVEPIRLSLAVRTFLLEYGGDRYPDALTRIAIDSAGTPSRGSWYHSVDVEVDSDTPTPAEIDTAIQQALAGLEVRRRELQEAAAVREAEKQAEERKKAEREAARVLLADELEQLTRERDQARKDRDILSRFLGVFSDEELEAALARACADSKEAAADELRTKVSDAATVHLFDG